MGNELRPGLTGHCQPEIKHGNFPGLKMGRQLEAVGKQRLHHETHLVY
jgi:hypothetical protein